MKLLKTITIIILLSLFLSFSGYAALTGDAKELEESENFPIGVFYAHEYDYMGLNIHKGLSNDEEILVIYLYFVHNDEERFAYAIGEVDELSQSLPLFGPYMDYDTIEEVGTINIAVDGSNLKSVIRINNHRGIVPSPLPPQSLYETRFSPLIIIE